MRGQLKSYKQFNLLLTSLLTESYLRFGLIVLYVRTWNPYSLILSSKRVAKCRGIYYYSEDLVAVLIHQNPL